MSAVKRRALGRGLAALIPGAPERGAAAAPTPPPAAVAAVPASTPTASEAAPAPPAPSHAAYGGPPAAVAVDEIHPWREQPRRIFIEARLEELAASIRAQGVIQPIVVRPREGGGYEIVDGERRWRAAQRAGVLSVPVVVRDIPPDRVLETSIVANLQREDLNPIEQAEAYQRLIQECGYTQETLASRVGKDRTTVTNALRLLKLPPGVRDLVVSGALDMGHARAILGLDSVDAMERVARRTAAQKLSVRQVEKVVQAERAGVRPASPEAVRPSAAARDLGERLQRALGARVRVVETGPGRGHLEIHYGSLDELDAIVARISRPGR